MQDEVKQLPLDRLHRGPRGWGTNPIRAAGAGPEAAEALHLVSLRPGTSRGNHVHGNATEWLMVFGGACRITWKSTRDGSLRESDFGGEGPVLYEIPARVEHVITNTSGKDIYALVFYDHPEPDTAPSEIIPAGNKGGRP